MPHTILHTKRIRTPSKPFDITDFYRESNAYRVPRQKHEKDYNLTSSNLKANDEQYYKSQLSSRHTSISYTCGAGSTNNSRRSSRKTCKSLQSFSFNDAIKIADPGGYRQLLPPFDNYGLTSRVDGEVFNGLRLPREKVFESIFYNTHREEAILIQSKHENDKIKVVSCDGESYYSALSNFEDGWEFIEKRPSTYIKKLSKTFSSYVRIPYVPTKLNTPNRSFPVDENEELNYRLHEVDIYYNAEDYINAHYSSQIQRIRDKLKIAINNHKDFATSDNPSKKIQFDYRVRLSSFPNFLRPLFSEIFLDIHALASTDIIIHVSSTD